jgi:hyperosmotically inducible protein
VDNSGEATKENPMCKSSAASLFLLAVLLGGVAMAHVPPATAGQTSHKQATDMQRYIIREVRHELTMLPRFSLFDWIDFELGPDNSVVLNGQVRGLTLKRDAEDAVKRIEGVTKVVNNIEDLPVSPNDDAIRRRVYRAIYDEDGPLFKYAIEVIPSIHIIVKNGNVTLKGVVDSQADSDYAYIKAKGVPQIFSVKNELRIEKP